MNSPGLQAGDQKAHTFSPPLATRRAASGGGKRGVLFLFPGLKAGAIHAYNIIEVLSVYLVFEMKFCQGRSANFVRRNTLLKLDKS
jgi:hypothetical protein